MFVEEMLLVLVQKPEGVQDRRMQAMSIFLSSNWTRKLTKQITEWVKYLNVIVPSLSPPKFPEYGALQFLLLLPVQIINTCQFTFPTLTIFGLLFYWEKKIMKREREEEKDNRNKKKKSLISSDKKNAYLTLIQILNQFQTLPTIFPLFKSFYAF